MADTHETIADISAALRHNSRGLMFYFRNEENGSTHAMGVDYIELADRLDAALKRELPQRDPDWAEICTKCHDGESPEDCEYFGEPNGCNSPIYGQHPNAKPCGNSAALREALKRIVAASIGAKNANAPEWILQRMADIFAMATTALAAPATTEKSSTVGDAAKLREALIDVVKRLEAYVGCDHHTFHPTATTCDGITSVGKCGKIGTCAAIFKARAALAAPPRNCDVGTAEEQDARFVEWRYSKPLRTELGLDALEWAQMPYKEGGEK